MATQIARRPRSRPRAETRARLEMRSITVDGTPEECYRAWRNVEGFPRFLSFIKTVRPYSDVRFHWIACDTNGETVEWDVDLVEDRPNLGLAWRSSPGADVESSGVVRFEPATGGRGTVIRLGLEYAPRMGAFKSFGVRLVRNIQPKKELHRFKQWFETGEIATAGEQLCG